MGATSETPMLA